MNLKKQLSALGFKQLPEFDPGYFKHRNKVGFLLLLNEKHNLSYHVHTVNAVSCLTSAKRVVEFGQADRGAELLKALEASRLEDWVLYFRPHGLYPGLRDKVKELVQDYRSLNVKTARLDDTEPMWVYRVTHPDYHRAILISKNRELDDIGVVTEFLKKWRVILEDALNRETLPLSHYYKGMEQQREAMHQWLDDNVRKFAIIEIEPLVGKRRGEIRNHVSFENRIFSEIYFNKLSKLAA
jgi:hypothetical protein